MTRLMVLLVVTARSKYLIFRRTSLVLLRQVQSLYRLPGQESWRRRWQVQVGRIHHSLVLLRGSIKGLSTLLKIFPAYQVLPLPLSLPPVDQPLQDWYPSNSPNNLNLVRPPRWRSFQGCL